MGWGVVQIEHKKIEHKNNTLARHQTPRKGIIFFLAPESPRLADFLILTFPFKNGMFLLGKKDAVWHFPEIAGDSPFGFFRLGDDMYIRLSLLVVLMSLVFSLAPARAITSFGNLGDVSTVAPAPVKATFGDPCSGGVTVQQGDDYGKISRRVFGRSEDYEQLLAANPGVDPQRLVVGQCLLTRPAPSSAELLGVALVLLASPSPMALSSRAAASKEHVPMFLDMVQDIMSACGNIPGNTADNCFVWLERIWRLANQASESTPAATTPK